MFLVGWIDFYFNFVELNNKKFPKELSDTILRNISQQWRLTKLKGYTTMTLELKVWRWIGSRLKSCEGSPVNSLKAVGTLLLCLTQKTSAFFRIYNPGSMITGFASWNLWTDNVESIRKIISRTWQPKKIKLQGLDKAHSLLPSNITSMVNEIKISRQIREGVQQI